MSIVVCETYDSRKLNIGVNATSWMEVILMLHGSESEEDIKTQIETTLKPTYTVNTIPFTFDSYTMTHLGGGVWQCVSRYNGQAYPQVTFDTTGGTQRVTQSITTLNRYGVDLNSGGEVVGQLQEENVPDFKGAIGFDGEKVEGTDIITPVMNITETLRYKPELVTQDYLVKLRDLTGCVNLLPFRMWDIGEVLFLGARGSQRGTEQWEITYQFAISQNKTDIMVGDIGPIEKRGWDYLWIRYVPSADKNSSVSRPRYVYVEKVYPYEDLNQLYLGGSLVDGLGYGTGEGIGGGEGEGEEGGEGGGEG